MAITEKYVTTTGAGSHDGSSESNAWSLTEAMTNAAAGDRVNVKNGTYSFSSANVQPTNSGTAVSPIVWRGYNSSIGDLASQRRSNSNGDLDTTNFPSLSFTGWRLTNNSKINHIFESLSITGSYSGAIFNAGTSWHLMKCKVTNSSSNSAAQGVYLNGACTLLHSDVDVSLASASSVLAVSSNSSFNYIIGNRIKALYAAGGGRGLSNTYSMFALFNLILADGIGIDIGGSNNSHQSLLAFNTIYAGTQAITQGSYNYAYPLVLIGNHCTDASGYSVDSDYDATAQLSIISAFNRFRDNTSGNYNGFDDWVSATAWHDVTTDNGGASSDFVDAANKDFNLVSDAAALAAGIMPFLDIGALQRQASSASGLIVHPGMVGGCRG